jgi:hypothetical protein
MSLWPSRRPGSVPDRSASSTPHESRGGVLRAEDRAEGGSDDHDRHADRSLHASQRLVAAKQFDIDGLIG